jgi:UDP-glucose:(heptosyl)LPS alpha-1,3-glucosyltransferase
MRRSETGATEAMKIGLILERFDPGRGGLENWTWQFAQRLVARGHDVHVVTLESTARAITEAVTIHRLEMLPSPLARAASLAAELPRMRFDITHDMGAGWAADVIHPHGGSTTALWEHNLMRIPKWRQIRFWREKRYRELAELERRQHANSTAIIVAVSRMVARHFESLHRLPQNRMRVIYNGVDVERFNPVSRARYYDSVRQELGVADEPLFLMLAHNLLLKNADATIRAVAKLISSGIGLRLVIAGGKRPERFVRLAEKLRVDHAVTFLGQVDPIPYYAAADVFVHPTWYDPCSLVSLEASSCGLPVITTQFNGAAELMTNEKEGFILSDPADVGALAERMQQLLDPTLRQSMGAAGRALGMRHTFEDQTTQFLELYQEIVLRGQCLAR